MSWIAFFIIHDDVIKWKHFTRYWAFCADNSPVPGEFSAQRPVTRSFDVFFDLHLNKQLSKQSRGWWFETSSGSLWRQCNVVGSLLRVIKTELRCSGNPPKHRQILLTMEQYSGLLFSSWYDPESYWTNSGCVGDLKELISCFSLLLCHPSKQTA